MPLYMVVVDGPEAQSRRLSSHRGCLRELGRGNLLLHFNDSKKMSNLPSPPEPRDKRWADNVHNAQLRYALKHAMQDLVEEALRRRLVDPRSI